ncbi:carbohydrate kinase family protein [Thermococcus gammatolerans]|uniref:Carbohydrate kinase, pfkB/Ribokinase family n=1 Tax=Thermococcus gammatolerans (strain DSM 15229 / JCM 11827 / EJ3) TaxID=593117 RepID=C5A377_THEGJ|nr:carbohydrate kinase family protein [Thermococcus gammatolerans]ACS32689.1 Carbohydrate kinase, pfkB/Ribokinase family [Thermococcus gammatolerans EJ3]
MEVELVVLGHVSIDTIVFPDGGRIEMPGGAAAAVATSAALAGAKVGLVTKVGEDFPREWLQKLAKYVDIRGVQVLPGKTIHIWVIYKPDGSVESPVEVGVAERMGETPIPEEYLKAKLFHIAPIPPEEQLKVIERLGKMRISVDFNPTYYEDYRRKPELVRELVSRSYIVFPNEREAKLITGLDDVRKAAEELHSWGAELVVVTRGEKGVLIYDGDFHEFPALPVEGEIDPTGAGDAFAGGFLAGLVKGKALEECARLGLERAREVLKKSGSWSV